MSLDIAQLSEENERLSKDNTSNSNFFDSFVKMPEGAGVVELRLLPPAVAGMFSREKSPFFCSTRVHKVNNKSLHCPKELQGGRWVGECPICKYYNWLWQESEKKSGEEQAKMQAEARSIKPIERYYYNCIVRTQVNPNSGEVEKNVGPKILSVGKTLHKQIISAIIGSEELKEAPLGDVTDFLKGRDFKLVKSIKKSGKDSYPDYGQSKFLEPSPLGDPEQCEKWMTELHDLLVLRMLKDSEELKHELKIHLGVIPDNSTDFDPSEFQTTPTVSVSMNVPAAKEQPSQTVVEATAAAVETGSETLLEDDFINQLREIG